MFKLIFGFCLVLSVLTNQSVWAMGGPLRPQLAPGSPKWVAQERDILVAAGYQPWAWSTRDGLPAGEFKMLPLRSELTWPKATAFIKALSDSKTEIMRLYQDTTPVTDAEYILLAQMAIGFLGNESNFFRGEWYIFKESCIYCYVVAKWAGYQVGLTQNDTMSRGAIQMKVIPEAIHETYDIEPWDLNDPTDAARAIMGYLIESLSILKHTAINYKLDYVTPETYQDYLPYLYFGAARRLREGNATPDQNGYVLQMRRFMGMVEIYTR